MNSIIKWYCDNAQPEIGQKNNIYKFSCKNERKFLKLLLLECLHQLFCELFQKNIQLNLNHHTMECYAMDNQIIRALILGIVETGEYTLEGIAYYTNIPFDVIYDAACGTNRQFSVTPWIRIVSLYIQVKPDIAQMMFDRLLEMKENNHSSFAVLLNES